MRWLLLLLAFLTVPALAETRNPDEYFFQPKFGDLKSDLDEIGKQGKTGILLMFEEEGCPWCAKMKATVLNQSGIQDYYRQHFIIYLMDKLGDTSLTDFQGKDTTEKAFAFEQRVRGTPTFIFYGADGKELYRLTGITRSADEFMLLGRYVVDGAYRNGSFESYKKNPPAAP